MVVIKDTAKSFLARTKEILSLIRTTVGVDIRFIHCRSLLAFVKPEGFSKKILSKRRLVYERGH